MSTSCLRGRKLVDLCYLVANVLTREEQDDLCAILRVRRGSLNLPPKHLLGCIQAIADHAGEGDPDA